MVFPESSFIHPVLVTDGVDEKTDGFMPHVFLEDMSCRIALNPACQFLSPVGALCFGFSKFLNRSMSWNQVDPNISQTLAIESEISEEFSNTWAWLPALRPMLSL